MMATVLYNIILMQVQYIITTAIQAALTTSSKLSDICPPPRLLYTRVYLLLQYACRQCLTSDVKTAIILKYALSAYYLCDLKISKIQKLQVNLLLYSYYVINARRKAAIFCATRFIYSRNIDGTIIINRDFRYINAAKTINIRFYCYIFYFHFEFVVLNVNNYTIARFSDIALKKNTTISIEMYPIPSIPVGQTRRDDCLNVTRSYTRGLCRGDRCTTIIL